MPEALAAEVRRIADQCAGEIGALMERVLAHTASERENAVRDARRAAEVEVDGRVAAQVERVRAEDARHFKTELARVRAESASTLAAEIARTRTDAEAQAKSLLTSEIARSRAEREAQAKWVLSAELDRARADERHGFQASRERILDGVRRLDEATALTEVLHALVSAAAQEAPRVAMLVAQGGGLRGWRFIGFEPDVAGGHGLEMHESDDTVIVRALRSGQIACVQPQAPGGATGPSFAHLPAGQTGLAVPLRVGGRVVAVVYADDVAAGDRGAASAWADTIEVFVRHACRCLESLTALRSVQAAVAR